MPNGELANSAYSLLNASIRGAMRSRIDCRVFIVRHRLRCQFGDRRRITRRANFGHPRLELRISPPGKNSIHNQPDRHETHQANRHSLPESLRQKESHRHQPLFAFHVMCALPAGRPRRWPPPRPRSIHGRSTPPIAERTGGPWPHPLPAPPRLPYRAAIAVSLCGQPAATEHRSTQTMKSQSPGSARCRPPTARPRLAPVADPTVKLAARDASPPTPMRELGRRRRRPEAG